MTTPTVEKRITTTHGDSGANGFFVRPSGIDVDISLAVRQKQTLIALKWFSATFIVGVSVTLFMRENASHTDFTFYLPLSYMILWLAQWAILKPFVKPNVLRTVGWFVAGWLGVYLAILLLILTYLMVGQLLFLYDIVFTVASFALLWICISAFQYAFLKCPVRLAFIWIGAHACGSVLGSGAEFLLLSAAGLPDRLAVASRWLVLATVSGTTFAHLMRERIKKTYERRYTYYR